MENPPGCLLFFLQKTLRHFSWFNNPNGSGSENKGQNGAIHSNPGSCVHNVDFFKIFIMMEMFIMFILIQMFKMVIMFIMLIMYPKVSISNQKLPTNTQT